ncbi:MAG: carbonic anhydrase, partial [Bdellovibrionota bacterium]
GGQTPKTLIIGCSDSRVDPAIVTNASPGEIFVIRNVANLVPPYDLTGGFHGVSAAIEFAVADLKVESIVILGHRQCGGIRALMLNQQRPAGFVHQWMSIAVDAKRRVLAKHKGADPETLCRHGEMESIVVSLRNLRTFPFVQEAIRDRNLSILGIYFDLEKGELCEYDEDEASFKTLDL